MNTTDWILPAPELSSVPMSDGASNDPESVEWFEMYPGRGYQRH
jgi:hypothetical protein